MPQVINGQTWWSVQNRTDWMDPNNPNCICAYTFSPNSFVPFSLNPASGSGSGSGSSSGSGTSSSGSGSGSGTGTVYFGETIPAYAIMRLAGPVFYLDDGEPVFPVCMPDDLSQQYQEPGLHFINGPTPIPLGKVGAGTQDLPNLVLWDWTAPGGTYNQQFTQSDARYYVSGEMGMMSGSWALQTAGNVISGSNLSTTPLTYWPFTRMSPQAVRDPKKRGKFSYDKSKVWVGRGTGCTVSNPDGKLAAAVNNLNDTILGQVVGG